MLITDQILQHPPLKQFYCKEGDTGFVQHPSKCPVYRACPTLLIFGLLVQARHAQKVSVKGQWMTHLSCGVLTVPTAQFGCCR